MSRIHILACPLSSSLWRWWWSSLPLSAFLGIHEHPQYGPNHQCPKDMQQLDAQSLDLSFFEWPRCKQFACLTFKSRSSGQLETSWLNIFLKDSSCKYHTKFYNAIVEGIEGMQLNIHHDSHLCDGLCKWAAPMMQEPTFCRDFAWDCPTLISGQEYEQDTSMCTKYTVNCTSQKDCQNTSSRRKSTVEVPIDRV